MSSGELELLIRELSSFLDTDSVSAFQDDSNLDEYDKSQVRQKVPSGGILLQKDLPSCAGNYNGKSVFVSFHKCGEMSITVRCMTRCRFRIVRNTIAARLNILGGRRIRSGNVELDREYLIRTSGTCNMNEFFRDSDVTEPLERLIPFFSVSGEPSIIKLAVDFTDEEVLLDFNTAVQTIQLISRIADMLEQKFPEEI